jgi:hypothetical protein
MTFHQCTNCGWSGPEKDFTFSWCDECTKAGVKGFVTALAASLAAFLFELVIR